MDHAPASGHEGSQQAHNRECEGHIQQNAGKVQAGSQREHVLQQSGSVVERPFNQKDPDDLPKQKRLQIQGVSVLAGHGNAHHPLSRGLPGFHLPGNPHHVPQKQQQTRCGCSQGRSVANDGRQAEDIHFLHLIQVLCGHHPGQTHGQAQAQPGKEPVHEIRHQALAVVHGTGLMIEKGQIFQFPIHHFSSSIACTKAA